MRYLIIILLLSSCSAGYHLRQAKRHLKIAEQKGADVSVDTIYKNVPVFIAALDSSVKTNPVLDTTQFQIVMSKYDSLLMATTGLISKDALIQAQKEIMRLRGRIIKGFSKDSTYIFPIDSITKITIVLKDGLVDSVGLDRKPAIIYKSVPVSVPVEIKTGWPWWWLLIAGVSGVGIGLILSVIKK